MLRKAKKCAARSKSWKNSKICQKLLRTWIMINAKNKKNERCPLTISEFHCWIFSWKTSQISVVVFFDITEFTSRTQFLWMSQLRVWGLGPKIYISFILIYVIALSFFFSKWGYTLLNYLYFWFYVYLHELGIGKYRGKRTL